MIICPIFLFFQRLTEVNVQHCSVGAFNENFLILAKFFVYEYDRVGSQRANSLRKLLPFQNNVLNYSTYSYKLYIKS